MRSSSRVTSSTGSASRPSVNAAIAPLAEVVVTKPAADALRALPPPLDEAALDALTVLESDPEAGNALRGRLRGVRSLRIGSFRLLYTIHDNAALVRVRAIRHRSVAYRSDPR